MSEFSEDVKKMIDHLLSVKKTENDRGCFNIFFKNFPTFFPRALTELLSGWYLPSEICTDSWTTSAKECPCCDMIRESTRYHLTCVCNFLTMYSSAIVEGYGMWDNGFKVMLNNVVIEVQANLEEPQCIPRSAQAVPKIDDRALFPSLPSSIGKKKENDMAQATQIETANLAKPGKKWDVAQATQTETVSSKPEEDVLVKREKPVKVMVVTLETLQSFPRATLEGMINTLTGNTFDRDVLKTLSPETLARMVGELASARAQSALARAQSD